MSLNRSHTSLAQPFAGRALVVILSILAGLMFSFLSYKFSLLLIVALVGGGVAGIYAFRHPEVVMVFAFSSGIFKEWLSGHVSLFAAFDFTMFIFGLSLLIVFYHLLVSRGLFQIRFDDSFLPLALFTVFLLISILYTPSPKYGTFKAFSFLAFNWGLFILSFLGLRSPEQVRRMTLTLVAVATVVSAYSILLLLRGVLSGEIIYSYRASFLGVNPISFANWIGVILILLIVHFPIIEKRGIKLAALASMIIMGVAMLAANSRGPMVSFVLTGGAFFVTRIKYMKARNLILLGISGIALLIAIYFILPEQVTSRYVDLFGGGSDVVSRRASKYTINTRIFAWKAALNTTFESIKNVFVGIGAGGFSNIFYGLDVQLYPHNMVFEILCELGLTGLVLLLWHLKLVFTKTFFALKKIAGKEAQVLSAYFFGAIYLLISAQFSGDINGNRRLWFFMGACIAIVALYNNREKLTFHD